MAFIVTMVMIVVLLTAACALLWEKQTRPACGERGCILIPCRESTQQLEMSVRSAYWSEKLEPCGQRRTVLIVLIDAGEKGYEARRLAAELEGVEVTDISALADRIRSMCREIPAEDNVKDG